jgi:antitoxin MazE
MTVRVYLGGLVKVSRWGNSLAIRLPAAAVELLRLEEGDDIEVHVLGERSVQIARKATRQTTLERLRKYRGALPADFHFDRLDAHERDE